MLYGSNNLVRVRGSTEGKTDNDHEKCVDSNLVPVCYWSPPDVLYDELLHMFYAKMVFDMTPGDGRVTRHALKRRFGCVGCF